MKKVPNSEEYHSHLFMAYARVGEYKKMQQAGMALYKIVPKNPYYFWSVMSLIMQVSMAFRMGLRFAFVFVYSNCP